MESFTPVKDLCLETPDTYVIKVRALNKSAVKEHARGKLFKVDFIDDEGSLIEACFYTEETDLFFPIIIEGATYTVKKADIAAANKRMTSVPHDYRLIFKAHTLIEKVDVTPKT
jgi:ssDNA-binding replication factor A large subunit